MIKNGSLGFIFYIGVVSLGRFFKTVPDGFFRIELTHSIVTHGSLLTLFGPIKYAPLQSILMAPFYALGYYFGVLSDEPFQNFRKFGELFLLYLFLPIVISSVCVLYFRILEKMGVDDNAKLVSTLLLFCATILLPYAGGLFSEPLSALLILISFYYFYTAPTTHYLSSNRKNFLFLGLLILNNFIFVLYFGLMIAYVFWASQIKRKNTSEAWRVALEGSLILGASVMLFLFYNYYRYEEFFNFGYQGEGFTSHWLVGMYGLIFSIGRGLVVYSPLTVFCILYFIFKNHEMESWQKYVFCTTMISFFVFMSVYAKWESWYGGWCWGPRFLLPFIPLIHLMFPMLLKTLPSFNRVWRVAISLAVVWAVGMNLFQHLDPDAVIPGNNIVMSPKDYSGRIFILEESPIFKIWEKGIFVMDSIRFLAGLGLCASLLWMWKKRFLPPLPAPQPSSSEAS